MQSPKKAPLAFVSWILFVSVAPLWGHPGLHHDIAKTSELIEASPDRADLFIQRAVLYRLDGQPEKALADLGQAARLGANRVDLCRERGFALADAGFSLRAEAELEEHLQSRPRDARAWALLGRLRAKRGATDAAIKAMRRGIDVEPSVEMTTSLGRVLEESGRMEEAAALYRTSLAQLGRPVVVQQALIRVETAREHYRDALELVDDLITRSPISTMWRIERANILERMGDQAGADRALEAALAEANRSVRRRRTGMNLYHRARVLARMGEFKAAIDDLEAAIRLAPGFKPAIELLDQLSPTGPSRVETPS